MTLQWHTASIVWHHTFVSCDLAIHHARSLRQKMLLIDEIFDLISESRQHRDSDSAKQTHIYTHHTKHSLTKKDNMQYTINWKLMQSFLSNAKDFISPHSAFKLKLARFVLKNIIVLLCQQFHWLPVLTVYTSICHLTMLCMPAQQHILHKSYLCYCA